MNCLSMCRGVTGQRGDAAQMPPAPCPAPLDQSKGPRDQTA